MYGVKNTIARAADAGEGLAGRFSPPKRISCRGMDIPAPGTPPLNLRLGRTDNRSTAIRLRNLDEVLNEPRQERIGILPGKNELLCLLIKERADVGLDC